MKKILVPTDFSNCALLALEFAIEVAKSTKARITIFHATSNTYAPVFTQECEFIPAVEAKKAAIKSSLEKIKWEFPELRKMDHDIVIKDGDVSEELHKALQDPSLDLVITGSKFIPGGEGYIEDHAYDAIKTAECPVLVIPETTKVKKIKNIAYATDFEKLKDYSILNIFKVIADTFGSKIHFVHVCNDIEEAISKAEGEEAAMEYYFETTEHSYNYVINDDLEKGLNEYIEKNKIDILAAVHKRPVLDVNMDGPSLINRLSAVSKVPLLTVKEKIFEEMHTSLI